MSNDPSAPYFDLGYARALSRRLRDAREPAPERPVERPNYIRFQKSTPEAGPTFDAAAIGESLRQAGKSWGAAAWHALLDGCTAAASGTGAFLMDGQGLVIATRGEIDEPSAERLGGRLMATLDQAAKMGNLARIVCIEVDGRWLSGLRGPNANLPELTLGILGDDPIGRDARRAITELLETMGG